MRVRKLSFISAFCSLILLLMIAGCGGSGSHPTPQGGFTTSNLNGTYAFSFSGTDASGLFFAAAGTMTLDGAGHVTSGVFDINRASGVATNVALSGTYAIKADGRGSAILNSTAGNMNLVFVVISNQHALIVRFEGTATGSGSMDLSNSGAFSTTALAGSFAFNLSGLDSTGNPEATAGSMTMDNTGALTTGVQDLVDDTLVLANQPISAGTLTIASTGRGTLALTTSTGTLDFAIYPVSTNFFKAVEVDVSPVLAGDVFRQQGPFTNAALNGPFAFTIAGANQSTIAPLALGGVFTSNGAGVISSGTEDQNNGGAVSTNVAISGAYSITGLRGTMTLNGTGFSDNFVFYPTTGGIQLLELDSGVVLSGVAFQQSGAFSNASIQGTYGLNLTGVTQTGEIDFNAAINANGTGGYNGILDANQSGSLVSGTSVSGNYSVGPSGRGPLTLSSGLGGQNLAVYVVDASHALFLDVDSNVVAIGQIQHQ